MIVKNALLLAVTTAMFGNIPVLALEYEESSIEKESRQQLYDSLAAREADDIRAKISQQSNFTEKEAQVFVDGLMKESGLQEVLCEMAKIPNELANISNDLKKSRIQLQEMICRSNSERLLSYAQAQELSNPHLSHFINKETEALSLILRECKVLDRCCNNPQFIQSHNELFQKIESYWKIHH